MNVKTAGRATAAVAALGTVLAPVAASTPVAAAPTRATATGTATRPASRSQFLPCGAANDYSRQLQASINNTQTGAASGDVIELWYSPTTRCVYGKYVNYSSQCAPGLVDCRATVVRRSSDGSTIDVAACGVDLGAGGCTTARVNDANVVSAARGNRKVTEGSTTWFGKTSFF